MSEDGGWIRNDKAQSSKSTVSSDAATLLREAADIIEGQRAVDYGSFTDNMAFAGDIAGLKPHGIARALIGVKAARLHYQPDHHDSMVDLLGYTALTLAAYGEL